MLEKISGRADNMSDASMDLRHLLKAEALHNLVM